MLNYEEWKNILSPVIKEFLQSSYLYSSTTTMSELKFEIWHENGPY